MKKRTLTAVLLALALLCSCQLAAAEEAVWGADQNRLTSRGTLQEALDAAKAGTAAYIRLLSAPPEEKGYEVYGGTFTLDLNGKSITSDGYPLAISGGDVTLADSAGGASVRTSEPGYVALMVYGGKLTVTGGEYTSNNYAVVVFPSASVKITDGTFTGGHSALLVQSGGSAKIEDGLFTGTVFAVEVYGSADIDDGTYQAQTLLHGGSEASVVVRGGDFSGDSTHSTVENYGTMRIEGGSFEGRDAVVYNDGELTVTGGEFTLTNAGDTTLFYNSFSMKKLSIADAALKAKGESDNPRVLINYLGSGTIDLSGCSDLDGWKIRENYMDLTGKCTLPEGYYLITEDGRSEDIGGEYYLNISRPVTLTFNWNDGKGRTKSMDTFSGVYTDLPDDWTQAPDGLYFAGWSEKKTGGEIIQDGYVAMKNTTLYAQWGVLTCIFNENVGAGSRTKTVKDSLSEPMVFGTCPFEARPGFFFDGWALDPDGEDREQAYYPDGSETEPVVVYALWEQIRNDALYVGGKPLAAGEYIDNNGVVSTTKPEGGYAYFDHGGVLTLSNYSYTGRGSQFDDAAFACINALGTLRIELVGENTLIAQEEGVRAEETETVEGDVIIGGSGRLTVRSTEDAINANGGDLIILGGDYVIEDEISDGLDAYNDVIIYDGTFSIRAGDDGVEAGDYLRIYGGTFDITAYDGLSIDEEDLEIYGGMIHIVAEDDGIFVDDDDFYMYGGTISILAADDGADADEDILFYGGTLIIDAGDHGLEARDDDIIVEGGELTIYSTNAALAALDDEIEISGGKVTAYTENGEAAVMAYDGLDITAPVYEPENGKTKWIWMDDGGEYDEYDVVVDENGVPAKYVVIGQARETAQVPVTGESRVKAPAKIVGRNVILEPTMELIEQAVGAGTKDTLTIDLSGVDAQNPALVLDLDAAKLLGEAILGRGSTIQNLAVALPGGMHASFDRGVLSTLTAAEDGVTLRFLMYPKVEAELTAAQKETIGERPAYHVFWLRNGVPVQKLGGTATLSARYWLASGESADGLSVCYVDEQGAKETCDSAYDEKTKQITWTTDHFSEYMIDHLPADSLPGAGLPLTGDSSMLGAWVMLLGAAGAGLRKIRRRR